LRLVGKCLFLHILINNSRKLSDMTQNYRDSKEIINSVEDVNDDILDDSDSERTEYGDSSSVGILHECYTGWSKDESADLMAERKYLTDRLVFIEKVFTKGPADKQGPKPSKRTYEQIMKQRNLMKRANNSSNSNKNVIKKFKPDWKNMEPNAFSNYLESLIPKENLHLCPDSNEDEEAILPTDFTEVGPFIKIRIGIIDQTDTKQLKRIIQMGKYLTDAMERFKYYKIKTKLKINWPEWIENEVGIRKSRAQQYRQLSTLVKKYSRLGKVQTNFEHMREMLNKITITFMENPDIGRKFN